jgi:hypothetical protein
MDTYNVIALGRFISNLDKRPTKPPKNPKKVEERKDHLVDSIMTLLKKMVSDPICGTFQWIEGESAPQFHQVGYVIEFTNASNRCYKIYLGYHYDWKNRSDKYCFQIKKCATGKFIYNILVPCSL